MGWDAEQAEDQYWEARAHGLSDADILRGDYDEDDDLWHLGHRQEKPKMDNSRKTAAQLRAMIEEAQSLLSKIENLPAEPEQDLVVFDVQFNGYGRVYHYAAIRVERGWYITGVSGLSKVEWHAIFDFFEGRSAKVIKLEPAVRLSDVADFV